MTTRDHLIDLGVPESIVPAVEAWAMAEGYRFSAEAFRRLAATLGQTKYGRALAIAIGPDTPALLDRNGIWADEDAAATALSQAA